MPTNYYCMACNLGFALGWFHYHHVAEGHWAETLLVCSACGTMHSVGHSAPTSKPVLGGLFSRKTKPGKLETLMAQPGPCFINNAENDVLQSLKPWEKCEVTHVLRPPSKHSYMKNFLDLGPVKCHHCARLSSIVKDRDYHDLRCPACGQPHIKVTKQWLT
jgi:hypothetical protein